MTKKFKKVFVYLLILLFLILGFIGLALPLVPQVVFFALALVLISFEVPWVDRKIIIFLEKYPEILKKYLSLKLKLENYLK